MNLQNSKNPKKQPNFNQNKFAKNQILNLTTGDCFVFSAKKLAMTMEMNLFNLLLRELANFVSTVIARANRLEAIASV